ncbi:MAG TPA: AsmA family protein [Acidobacteriaceae bacterium]|jgi:hypothetical protein|nr:AsmA family protein [Acidobacteriaceae bacterium]
MNSTEEPLAADEPREGRRSRRKLIIAAALAVMVLLAIFVPPLVNLGHYRRSITASMEGALGRPVAVGEMELRLLPVPGIAMTDFTVAEDPAYGYEPVLHANSVVASMRLSSLWRGRLEVSRISLDEASLNLVRSGGGQWNVGSVLLHASQMPNEATGQRYAGAHPRFPYIEATDARINFKNGAEKRPFSLMNAEFAMWQASSGEWRVRLKAQPVRTDLELHLSDAGELQVEGSLHRAESLRTMPVNLQAEWSGAQLGQVSRLLTGGDSGWRGDLDVTATLAGTADDLALKTRVRIDNLRRQEFQPPGTVNVDARCQSRYQHEQRLLGDITCFLPAGDGHFLLTGSVHEGAHPGADLQMEMNQIPAQYPVTLLGLMRPHAGNVTATGTINGSFHLERGAQTTLTGDAATTAVTLTWTGNTLALPELHFGTQAPMVKKPGRRTAAVQSAPVPVAVLLDAFAVPMGEPQPLMVDARLMRSGFVVHLAGAAAVDRLTAVGGNFGFLGTSLTAMGGKGRADLDTTTTGGWVGPLAGSGPAMIPAGSVKVQDVEWRPGFLAAPVEIASADMVMTPSAIAWQNVALHYQGLALRGSVQYPAMCGQPPCAATFAMTAGTMSGAAIETALQRKRPGFLGEVLSGFGSGTGGAWPAMRGTVEWDTLSLGRLEVRKATAAVRVEGARLTLASLDGSALGGTLHATGEMTMTGGTPEWDLDARLIGAKANEAGALFKEHWGAGAANADAHLQMAGWTMANLAASAAGTFHFSWQNGGLAGAAAGSPLARFDRWTAGGTIGNSTLTLTGGGVARAGVVAPVRGKVGFDRHLALTVTTRKGDAAVSGTVARPH